MQQTEIVLRRSLIASNQGVQSKRWSGEIYVNVSKQTTLKHTYVKNGKNDLALRSREHYALQQPGVTHIVDWKISKPEIASVDEYGRIIAHGTGKVTISARVNGQTMKVVVKVR